MTEQLQVHCEIVMNVQLDVRRNEDQGLWISWCPELDLYSQSDESSADAVEGLKQTISTWTTICLNRGILEKSLAARNFVCDEYSVGSVVHWIMTTVKQEFYADFDEDSGFWGVFGSESSFCYSTWCSEDGAEKAANQMNQNEIINLEKHRRNQ